MKWHHSLYWRIAIGFVSCLALLLMVQAMLFVWVIARSGRTIPNQPPERLAQTIAIDASSALERDPAVDLDAYIRQEYANDVQPFFVLLTSGATIEIGGPFDATIVEESRARFENLRRLPPGRFVRGRGFGLRRPFEQGPPLPPPDGDVDRPLGPPAGRPERGGPPDGFDPMRPPDGNPRGEGRRGGGMVMRPMLIVANEQLVGAVIVPPQPPFAFLLARYGPVLGLVALVTLVVGAVFAAVVIFGPARARLRQVEEAARRLGGGDLTARAPERGRDEVTAVASAFNAMAADLSARAAALQASDRARRQLLADVSHELNTPMTAMRGYLETLSMPGMTLDADTRQRYLGIIGDETARLERIVGDLLDLARLEDGGGALRIDTVPVEALFDRVMARHEREAADAAIEFDVDVEPAAAHVQGDRDRLEQALQNLTANALRYAPSGSTIGLAATRHADGVTLSVTNAGGGIAPEHQPHVFDRFYRAESSRVRASAGGPGGSGLGLSIVKAIVERHGGSVAVKSAPGRTTFQLTIPASQGAEQERTQS